MSSSLGPSLTPPLLHLPMSDDVSHASNFQFITPNLTYFENPIQTIKGNRGHFLFFLMTVMDIHLKPVNPKLGLLSGSDKVTVIYEQPLKVGETSYLYTV